MTPASEPMSSHEMQLPPPAQWIFGPLSMLFGPRRAPMGYRGRYDKYSGPR